MSWRGTAIFSENNRHEPMQYHSGPDTLLWTRLGQTCWEREDGVKVLKHWSPSYGWAVNDPSVFAHTGWFRTKFEAMDAADIVLPDQRPPEEGGADRMRAIEKRLDAAEQRIAKLENRNRPEPPPTRYR